MNLDLFKDLIKSTKENDIVQSFIKELGDCLRNELNNNERNQIPLVQKILDGRILTARYRDEINIQRHDIINNYSKEHSEQGEFYYVYNKRSNNTYGIVSHKNGEDGVNIGIKESQLPEGAGVDSVLREKNGKYVLDEVATKELQEELTEMINRLLDEQASKLEAQRIEGHLYEFVEKSGDTVLLIDKTKNDGNCFEEVDFPSENLNNATEGSVFQYLNGEYRPCTIEEDENKKISKYFEEKR